MRPRLGPDLRRGLAFLAAGLLVVVAAQRLAPLGAPPLYDGVVVAEPYRWLVPPAGGKGGPTSASGTEELDKGASPFTAFATTEQPPQAQVFAISGTLILPPGTTSIAVSITPILPATLPTDGHIAGNVYRISVTNQDAAPLTALAKDLVSVVLRGPDGTVGASVELFTGGAWQKLKTEDAGFAATWLAVVTGFGDFALVAPGPGGPSPTASPVEGTPGSPTPAGSPGEATPTPTPTLEEPTPTPIPGGTPSPAGGGLPVPLIVAGVVIAVGLLAGAFLRGRAKRPPPHRDQRRANRR